MRVVKGFEEFGDWLGAWTTRLEGYRIIRYATVPPFSRFH